MNFIGWMENEERKNITRYLKGDLKTPKLSLDMRYTTPILFEVICDFLKEDTHTTTLNLYSQELNPRQCKRVANLLLRNKTLQHVLLSCSCSFNVGMIDIAMMFEKVLRKNKTLKSIDFMASKWTRTSFESILNGLSQNKTIESISFRAVIMKDYSMFKMITACGSNITHLDFEGVAFDEEHAREMGECLRVDEKLEWLNLSLCNMFPVSCMHILSALLVNRTLTRLDFDGNHVGGEGGAIVAQLIRENPVLKHLGLYDCKIPDTMCRKIVSDLSENTTLAELDLRINFVSTPTHEFALNVMKNNATLVSFQLIPGDTTPKSSTCKALQCAVNRNRFLSFLVMCEWGDKILEDEEEEEEENEKSLKRQRIL